ACPGRHCDHGWPGHRADAADDTQRAALWHRRARHVAAVGPISAPPPFATTNVASMKHCFIQRTFVAKLVGYIHQHSPPNFIAAPGLKAPMNGFVVRIALRQHVPLRAGVEYPQYSFENTSGLDRLASRTSIGDVLFRKMIPDALPLLVCQPNHPDIYSRSTPPSNFEIGSSHSTVYCDIRRQPWRA